MRRNAADAARRTGKRKDGYEKNQKEPNMKNANGQTRERNLRAFGVAQNGQADQQQPNPVMQVMQDRVNGWGSRAKLLLVPDLRLLG